MRNHSTFKKYLPWILIATLLATYIVILRFIMHRPWTCTCNKIPLWAKDPFGPHSSQHLFDAYSFSHIEHGLALSILTSKLLPSFSSPSKLAITLLLECAWEIFENSPFGITIYRATAKSTNYTGDTILNSAGDVFSTFIGFFIFEYFGWRRALFVFAVLELLMLLTIQNNAILSLLKQLNITKHTPKK